MKNNDEISWLVNEIKRAQDAYYNGENAIMEDSAFDKLWDRLTELDPTNPILHTIGEDSGSAFAKAPHVMHMFSQQKCKEPDEFLDWVKKHPENEYLVEYKLDGSSLELQYVNGIFTRAVTRGKDGTIGDDVTANIVTSDVPREIPNKNFTGGFRGEVLLYHDDFAKYFTDKANCRNAANGILKRKEGTNKEFLHVICYDCQWLNYSHVFETELEKLTFMEENGFNVVPYFWFSDPNEIIKFRDKLGSERFTALNYDIDGLVIKCNDTDKEDVKRDRPERQIAFKFVLDEQVSPLIGVEWSVAGKTRTPVGIVEPVRLCGTTVQRANLCNLDLIKKLGIKIGSKVVMVKRGEIIPKIIRVAETPADATDIQIPTVCETCGQPLTITNTDIFCSNPNCPNTICHRIETWCKVFKVYGMGEANIKSLFYEGVITDIVDFYNSDEVDDGIIRVMGEANGSKVLPRLKAIAKQPQLLSSILEGFDMDFVGEATSKLLTKELSYDWEEFKKKLNYANVAAIPGLGDKSALNIVDSIKANIDKLDELIKYFKLDVPVATGTKLAGMNFCVTGEVHKFANRKELEMFIEMNGGKTQSGVSKKTNYLICNEASESGKYVTATKLGVPIITEDEFIERFSK